MGDLKEIIKDSVVETYLSQDIEEVRKELSSFGVDLDLNRRRQDKLIKQLKFKLIASVNEKKDNVLLEIAISSFKKALMKGTDKPIAYLSNLIRENQLTVQYNNLKELNEEEIEEIIKDQNLIEIIEFLEKEQ